MTLERRNDELPAIPGKRYFTIGEASALCDVKPHVLRYWEQVFDDLAPVKRRGNRRYYQRHDILTIRRIRTLLYGEGFTVGGAQHKLRRLDGDGGSEVKPLLARLIADLEELRRTL